MSLIVVGTMAFDAIQTPFGKVNQIVGGSATYAAYAAANFIKPVQQISIVGLTFRRKKWMKCAAAVLCLTVWK
jgi:hypothetical protein